MHTLNSMLILVLNVISLIDKNNSVPFCRYGELENPSWLDAHIEKV